MHLLRANSPMLSDIKRVNEQQPVFLRISASGQNEFGIELTPVGVIVISVLRANCLKEKVFYRYLTNQENVSADLSVMRGRK